MKSIVFVTSSPGKVESAKKNFEDINVELEFYKYDGLEPDVNDIEFIAKTKVMWGFERLNRPCIALDAGFYINHFPGEPGFPGAFPKRRMLENENMGLNGVLRAMAEVDDRSCYTKECVAYYNGNQIKYFYGTTLGTLATSIRGIYNPKSWSDLWKIFIPQNHTHTLAEMSDEELNNRRDGHTSALKEFACYVKKL